MAERVTSDSGVASDIEIAMFFSYHIDHPCSAQVGDRVLNIRDFYIREARNILTKFTNQDAKTLLELKIREYQPTPSSP